MGQGIQQAPVDQGSGSSGLLDIVKVLYEPGAVFARVGQRPRVLAPFLVISVVQVVLYFLNLPFMKAGLAAQFASRPAGGPDPSKFLFIGAFFIPVGIGLALLIGGGLLWVLVSLLGGEAKFKTLLSVACYGAVPSVILLGIVGAAVLQMKGVAQVSSPQDLQPALGLDLLASGATGFMLAALKAINPFGIWGLVLTAIGVSTTHRLSKRTGYIVATIAFLIGVLIAGGFASFGNRG